ncbi:Zn-dependent dipeptidase, dipeptidase homolog [Cognatiyoonia koreensis]|uniref:Zn-dependent dipeptidase, dipeptidase homolog n=1 Tax=Cognatiyoonia koreensis TaxID=364200 RepID=A0A1I0RE58_9RHOB|nr:membrane dipeptidase [Cognatiyoonia koreensis]SEW38527.1 Zn-dependent dipeptidase, dipeptidase homolog [Cognatiyoonia koreensis]
MKTTIRLLAGIVVLALVAFFIFAPGYVEAERNAVRSHDPYPVSADARSLHGSLVIGDWHADSLLWKRDLTRRSDRGHVDIPRLLEGNVAIQMFTAVTKSPAGQNYHSNASVTTDNITLLAMGQLWPPRTWGSLFERALYQAEKLDQFAQDTDTLRIIKSKSDLEDLLARRASGELIVGGLLGIEGGHALEADLANLQRLTDAGYRMIGLHHFFDNALGGSLHGKDDEGLTEFGKAVVREVQSNNLILDVAHSSPQVARDVLAMTEMPIVVSHTGVHSVCPVKRNYTDDLMQDIAATGGVIAIGYWADVLCDDSPAGIATTIAAAIALVGEDHVSLGSDFDGSVTTALDTSELSAITHALIVAGLSERQIRKVMGENMLRVLRERLPE